MSQPHPVTSSRRPGLDLLRLLAALLIFTQHSLSSCELDQWIDIGGLRIGRIGTSLFFMLAGLLAASSSRQPVVWLRERLNTVLPTFWLVTLAGFAIASVAHFKRFDAWQVVCQMSGMGYFTHGEAMINAATWFMSPLLLLYLTATLVRLTHPTWGGLLAGCVCICLAVLVGGHGGTVACHAVTYLTAFLVAGKPSPSQWKFACLASAIMAIGVVVQPEFRYGTISLLLLAASGGVTANHWLAVRFTTIAYEWFLVHGICVTLIARGTHHIAIEIPAAAVTSLVAALALKWTVQWLRGLLTRRRAVVVVADPAAVHAQSPGTTKMPNRRRRLLPLNSVINR